MLAPPPELDRVGEGAGLLAELLELAGVLGELERDAGDPGLLGARPQHRPVEQRRVAEARRREDDAVGSRRRDALAHAAAACPSGSGS